MTTNIQLDRDTYQAKIDKWASEVCASISPEMNRQFDEETIGGIIKTMLMERMNDEFERDPVFREYVAKREIEFEVSEAFEARRPTGSYREDGMFPINDDGWMLMPKATREHLLAWSAIEPGTENLRYIAQRLAAWDQTKHQKLADLEKDLAEASA